MGINEFSAAYLSMLLPEIPIMLVLLVGMVLAVVFWGRHPGVSRLTLIALLIFLVLQLLGPFMSLWTYHQTQLGWDIDDLAFVSGGIGIFQSNLAAIGYVMLLAAAFGWRVSPGKATPGT